MKVEDTIDKKTEKERNSAVGDNLRRRLPGLVYRKEGGQDVNDGSESDYKIAKIIPKKISNFLVHTLNPPYVFFENFLNLRRGRVCGLADEDILFRDSDCSLEAYKIEELPSESHTT